MLGLGLALGQPDRNVLVVTGDGEMLMGLGSLATIGGQRPANLSIVVLDNELYGETGRQQTHTALGVDLAAVARACGFEARTVTRQPTSRPCETPSTPPTARYSPCSRSPRTKCRAPSRPATAPT